MSNRSSRFVHPLQSLTSALAGVFRPKEAHGPRGGPRPAGPGHAPAGTTGQAQSDTTPPALESATVGVLAERTATIELVFDEATTNDILSHFRIRRDLVSPRRLPFPAFLIRGSL